MASFNTESFPDSLAIATETGLTMGTIDDIQKLHIRTVPLHEQPRRIAHQDASRTLCVTTLRSRITDDGEEAEEHFVRLLDDQTFEVLTRLQAQQPFSRSALESPSANVLSETQQSFNARENWQNPAPSQVSQHH